MNYVSLTMESLFALFSSVLSGIVEETGGKNGSSLTNVSLVTHPDFLINFYMKGLQKAQTKVPSETDLEG